MQNTHKHVGTQQNIYFDNLWFPDWCFAYTLIWGVLFWTDSHFSGEGYISMIANHRSSAFWPFWCSLLSGLGRRRPGRHHEQQRAVSCIPVTHLLNFTEKCQKRGGKKFNPNGKNCQSWQWALWEPVQCPPKASGGWSRHKKGSPGFIWCLDPTVNSIYLT